MRIKSIIALLSIVALFVVSSCNKEDEQLQKQDTKTSTLKSARINTGMTNEEMETHITAFMDKLDEPTNFGDMNYEEAFEDVEATLNYKYVNYDYSKCANTQEFAADIQIDVDADGNMRMESIAAAYNQILADWKKKYHSISETEKTPIVFDITDITENTVKYTMIVGYGELDLKSNIWNDLGLDSVGYFMASVLFNQELYYQLNNNMVQWLPVGRLYMPNIGQIQYLQATLLPSYSLDPFPPNNNGLTDYRLFYTNPSMTNYHEYLHEAEFNYYFSQLITIMTDYLSTNSNANYVTYTYVRPYIAPLGSQHIVWHGFKFNYGYSYYTVANLYTL